MKFHLVINNNCNLNCKYCGQLAFNKEIISKYEDFEDYDENIPCSFNENQIKDLIEYLKKDKDPWIIFYGGEPLLSASLIEKIVSKINFPIRYAIQTNGILLDKINSKTLNKFDTILVSIDGDKKTTNYFRGKDTYEKIMQNIKLILKNNYKGKIIARMTLMERASLYNQTKYLLKNKDYCFKEIHFQLNANFYPDYELRDFKKWSKQYLKDFYKLTNFWINEIKKNKNIIRIYPLIGITNRLLEIEENKIDNIFTLPCGSGHSNYSIQSDGKIIPCPVMIGMKNYYLGEIKDAKIKNLKKINCKDSCLSCSHYNVCGGRCLYSNITKPWKKKQFNEICNITKQSIDYLKLKLPVIKKLIKDKKIKRSDFEYEKYIGPEIIP
ncbi:MAG: TIGR04084 family radical SAM/SPASM domain-containing protein [archaeon]